MDLMQLDGSNLPARFGFQAPREPAAGTRPRVSGAFSAVQERQGGRPSVPPQWNIRSGVGQPKKKKNSIVRLAPPGHPNTRPHPVDPSPSGPQTEVIEV
jgi:hypothetical protein